MIFSLWWRERFQNLKTLVKKILLYQISIFSFPYLKTAMIAAALQPISASPQCLCFPKSRSRRKPLVTVRNSLVIDTPADEQASAETPPESVSRRLILLRHARSSWEDRSLKGTYCVVSKLPISGKVNKIFVWIMWK